MAKKVVVIGAVALGSKAACRFKRIEPESEVIILDQDEYISYGGCGIPYYVSGDVSDYKELQSTSFHMVRDVDFFRKVKGITAFTSTRVTKIDRASKEVHAINREGVSTIFPYDKLVIGTGTTPRKLDIPGKDLGNIHTVANLHDAIAIKERVVKGEASSVAIVGGGFIGLEMAEAFTDMWGLDTAVIELRDQIMPGFVSKGMSAMAQNLMAEKGVVFYLGETVTAFEGEGNVERVITDKRTIDADLVILAAGIKPNVALAAEAGLDVGETGGIVVNRFLQTSDPDIYAGGDCIELKNLVSGKVGFYPLGSMANRQGRVIGTNLAGGKAEFPGAVGSFVVKVFDNALAGAGLTIETARACGFDAISVQMCQLDRAHFYPDKELMFLELVVEKNTKRVLGVQGISGKGDALVGRINAVAALLDRKPVIQDISNLELAYSPPFSSAMDIINALANVADNVLDGYLEAVDAESFEKYWEQVQSGDVCLIDCRAFPDAKPFVEKYPGTWNSIPQDELKDRISEVPSDKKVLLVCNTGVRSFEAQLNLRELGFDDTLSVQGGMAMLRKYGLGK